MIDENICTILLLCRPPPTPAHPAARPCPTAATTHRSARRAPAPYGGSVGAFLCRHPTTPPYDNLDHVPLADVKQEAALNALVAFRRLGLPVTDDAVASFDAQPRLAALAYRRALIDSIRRHRGRGTLDPRAPRRRDLTAARLSLDVLIARANRLGLDPTGLLFDTISQCDLEAVEDDSAAHLWRLWHEGIAGITVDQTRRAIALLLQAQRAKTPAGAPLSDAVRQRLRHLRRTTGLPLRIDLL